MEELTEFGQELQENTVYVNPEKSTMDDCTSIRFTGKNSILVIEDGVNIRDSEIIFDGNNAVVYLSRNKHTYRLAIHAHSNTCIYIGRDNYFNGRATLITSERQNIIIGDDGLFSFGIYVRTADPHLLYSCDTKERINESKSVLMRDHVWIGQGALILKGSSIGSGSVIGGGAVVSGKAIPSNTVAAGNPAKVVKRKIFFSKECVHNYGKKKSDRYKRMDSDCWIYEPEQNEYNLKNVDCHLCRSKSAEDKLAIIQRELVNNTEKNRFYIGEKQPSKKFRFRFWR